MQRRQSNSNGKFARHFLQNIQKGTKKPPQEWWTPGLLGTWPHFGAMLFLRSLITSRPTKDNIEDPDVCIIFATVVNEFDNKSAHFQEEAVICEGDIESSQSSQLNMSSNQSIAASQPSASGTNETCYKTQDTEGTL
jgi:hypothetical protein